MVNGASIFGNHHCGHAAFGLLIWPSCFWQLVASRYLHLPPCLHTLRRQFTGTQPLFQFHFVISFCGQLSSSVIIALLDHVSTQKLKTQVPNAQLVERDTIVPEFHGSHG